MAEMLNYQSTLNSITAARGSFHMQFSHYDPVRDSWHRRSCSRLRMKADSGRRRRVICLRVWYFDVVLTSIHVVYGCLPT